MGGACGMYEEKSHPYRVLVVEPEGKRPLGPPKRIWEENIKMYLQEIESERLDWIHLDRDSDMRQGLVNMLINLRVP
jgi:hypothetical protein